MKANLLRECARIARSKLENHCQFSAWPHYAFIIQNNSLIDFSTNTNGEPPVHMGYHERIRWGIGGLPKRHAELNAYKKAKGLLSPTKPFECLNIRLSRQGHFRLSMPCSCCFQFLQAMGCRQCWYSSEAGFLRLGIA